MWNLTFWHFSSPHLKMIFFCKYLLGRWKWRIKFKNPPAAVTMNPAFLLRDTEYLLVFRESMLRCSCHTLTDHLSIKQCGRFCNIFSRVFRLFNSDFVRFHLVSQGPKIYPKEVFSTSLKSNEEPELKVLDISSVFTGDVQVTSLQGWK